MVVEFFSLQRTTHINGECSGTGNVLDVFQIRNGNWRRKTSRQNSLTFVWAEMCSI